MPRDLILGTAGHIDHGKTSLVKALTGVDCDRLPEEKERGITIDIGFASFDLDDFRLGVVDVPGHERFVKNMLAGATGIDLVVLIVAADDSVMPQTREHLEILKLLGIRHGVIALTKSDLVDASTRESAIADVRELVRDSFLQDAPIIPTSAITGEGIDALKAAILTVCRTVEARVGSEWFRIAIDRSFIVQGHGTVVTGSVTSGTVKVGDEVDWLPKGERVRVRSLHNHDLPVTEVHRGQRAAINLAGVSHDQVARGQELAAPGFLSPSRCITVRLRTLPDVRRPLKHRTELRLHIGTAEVMASVSLLDCDEIKPGEWAIAQFFVREPITATWGQPFVVRDSSAQHTLGGGQVLQPDAKKIRRRHIEQLERIEKLAGPSADDRSMAAAQLAGFRGIGVADLVRGAGVGPIEAEQTLQRLETGGQLAAIASGHSRSTRLHRDVLGELDSKILTVLNQIHSQYPLMSSHDRQKVQSQLKYIGDDGLVHAAVDRLIQSKQLLGDLKRIARADFKPTLSGSQRKLKEFMVQSFRKSRFAPPEPKGFAHQAGGNAGNLNDLIDVCVAEGLLVPIAPDVYLHAESEAEMRKLVTQRLKSGPGATVAEIRDLLGTTRKFAVPLCEYLDRIGLTKREGDLRVLAG